jgi:serine/threonine-protein kinase RsbT
MREIRLRIAAEHDVARSLLEAAKYAEALGFDEQNNRKVVTAVSEIVRNIIKYAGSGELLIRALEDGPRIGMEVEARDRGPGIVDLDEAMQDHYSSGGTLGLGLPGVKRMMDQLEIDTAPGKGTRVTIRKWR